MNREETAGVDMARLIQRIATGPKLSKDLDRAQARAGLRTVLAGEAHPVQAAIFLVALRMKRETDEENLGLLDALLEAGEPATADVPVLVDVSDPYDGFARALPVSPFLPAVLAACGLPAVCHGVDSVGPKYGLTSAQVLAAAGAPVDLTPAAAAARVAHAAIGWAYVDQSRYCPALHGLADLRRLMVKRTAIATLERCLGPVRARERTHLLTGYVHVAYPAVYASLAHAAGFHSALVVRGAEGGVVPSLSQPAAAWWCVGPGAPQQLRLDPAAIGIRQEERAVPLNGGGAAAACAASLAALAGEHGPARDSLVYAGALALSRFGDAPDLVAGAGRVREALDSGAARERFQAGCGSAGGT